MSNKIQASMTTMDAIRCFLQSFAVTSFGNFVLLTILEQRLIWSGDALEFEVPLTILCVHPSNQASFAKPVKYLFSVEDISGMQIV